MKRKKVAVVFLLFAFAALALCPSIVICGEQGEAKRFKLGNELLMSSYHHLIEGKRVGLVTNQSGVNSKGVSTIALLAGDKSCQLTALYGPEHGIDGSAQAGQYVESYLDQELGIPVYSLYGPTRMPTEAMLRDVDLLIFDIQDIGARTYTYMSTLNYCLVAAEKYGKPLLVLDRPNPLGGLQVSGPVLEDTYATFVGVDNLPMAHGMTAAELARFYNRKIGADLTVVPMEGYKRNMLYRDTGLSWVPTSPNIPDLDSVFGYMATGLGEGTGVFQADKFKWIGGKGLDSRQYAALLNQAGLPGVTFVAEQRGTAGGVRLNITDPYTFDPARTGIHALSYAFILGDFTVPKSDESAIVMFDKVMGTNKIGEYLERGLTPQEIEAKYAPALDKFREERKQYLLPEYEPGISIIVKGTPLASDSPPYINPDSRVMVPLRAISEALGAQVDWEPETRGVTIAKQGKTVELTIDSPVAVVNGAEKTMDTKPIIKNSRTMVPTRFVAEYLEQLVTWHPLLQMVTIK
jgi:uncharacterized protein YbbC (DUF1343 family)